MKTKMKRICSLILALAMCLSVFSVAFAQETVSYNDESEVFFFELDDGRIMMFESCDCNSISEDHVTPTALTPQYPIGTIERYTVTVSNADLLAIDSVIGTAVNSAEKSLISETATKLINSKAGKTIATVAVISAVVVGLNLVFGNSGFVVYAEFEYSGTYIGSQGHYLYGWELTDADVWSY